MSPTDVRAYWESHYAARPPAAQVAPSRLMAEHAADLRPGTALELGAGQGGDAIWLATRGWTVTATDISAAALRTAASRVSDAAVGARITWERRDLAGDLPDGTFDLVVSSYLHSPVAIPRTRILQRAADRVAPGGALLIVGHSGWPSWDPDQVPTTNLPGAEELVAGLGLPAAGWTVDRAVDVDRAVVDPDGRPAHRPDSVVRYRRH